MMSLVKGKCTVQDLDDGTVNRRTRMNLIGLKCILFNLTLTLSFEKIFT